MKEGKPWSGRAQIPEKNDFSAGMQALEDGLLLSLSISGLQSARFSCQRDMWKAGGHKRLN